LTLGGVAKIRSKSY